MLVLHANHVVSADRLAEALWGDRQPASAANTLQTYVSQLRQALRTPRSEDDGAAVIRTQQPGYVLTVDPEQIDAWRFEHLVNAGRRALAASDPGEAATLFRQALSLWRGPVLDDVAAEGVASLEAARLEELRLAAVEEHAEAELALGHHAELVGRLRVLVAQHPLRERLSGQLMVALYRSGRQAEALRAFETTRRVLREELGLDPGPELRALVAEILHHAPSLAWAPSGRPHLEDAHPEGMDGGNVPLLGRDTPLRQLETALDRAINGEGRVVLIGGEPGIGKTRLAEELSRGRSTPDVDVAWGRCSNKDGAPAFWPWMEVVRHFVGSRSQDDVRKSLGPRATTIAQIVPEVKEIVEGVEAPPVLDVNAARFELYEAVAAFVTELARATPVTIVLDDAQWADRPSLELLGHLASRMARTRILVVVTYRDVDPVVGPPLSDALADLARERVTSRLTLTGLGPGDVGRFIAATTGAEPSAAVVSHVYGRTEGNPFFVGELAQLLQSAGGAAGLDPEAGRSPTVPGSVRDVIRRRISALPEATAEALGIAAIAGREVQVELLAQVSGVAPSAVLDALEPAVEARVLVEVPGRACTFRFTHALVNETLYEGTGAVQRARLHKRVGEAIEELYGADDELHLGELAHHFFLAVPAADPGRGLTYAVRAAEWSQGRLAYEQAEEHLRRALDLLHRTPAGRDRTEYELELVLRLGSLLMMTKGYGAPTTGEALTRARAICEQLGETSPLVRVLYGLMAYQLNCARHHEARELAEQLLDIANVSARGADIVAANQAVGVTSLFQGELRTAADHLERALRCPDGLHDPELASWFPFHPLVGCWTFLAEAKWLLGERQVAYRLASEAVAFAAELGHDLTLAHALEFIPWIAALDQDAALARSSAEKCVAFAADKGFPVYVGLGTVLRGWAQAQAGEPETGVAEIKRGMDAMIATGSRMLSTVHLGFLAEAQRAAGQCGEALASVDEALQMVEPTGERLWAAELHRLRGELLVDQAPEQAAEELRTALLIAQKGGAVPLEERAAESWRRLPRGPGPVGAD